MPAPLKPNVNIQRAFTSTRFCATNKAHRSSKLVSPACVDPKRDMYFDSAAGLACFLLPYMKASKSSTLKPFLQRSSAGALLDVDDDDDDEEEEAVVGEEEEGEMRVDDFPPPLSSLFKSPTIACMSSPLCK